jgi:5-enolpyruvylshikimate-3-phosphate synthase
MANGLSTIRNPLPSEDCLSATRAAKAFGSDVKIEREYGLSRALRMA